MDDLVLTKKLDFGRNEIKIAVRQKIIINRPEILVQVTNKLIKEAYIYVQGYVDALRENITEPYNIKEIRTFVFDRAFEYVIGQIDNS